MEKIALDWNKLEHGKWPSPEGRYFWLFSVDKQHQGGLLYPYVVLCVGYPSRQPYLELTHWAEVPVFNNPQE